jgi:hypothetical protein
MRIVLAGGAELYAQTMPLARRPLDNTYVRRAVDGSRPSIAASGTKLRARNMRPGGGDDAAFAFVTYRRPAS